MNIIIKYINSFKTAPKLRRVSMILLLGGLLLMPITSLIVMHGITSFETIIGSVKVPNQYVSLNIDIEDPDSMSVIIAYSIYNPSAFPVSNLQLNVEVRVNFIDKYILSNTTLPIFSDHAVLPDCNPLQFTDEFYTGFYSCFLIENLITFNDNYDSMAPVLFFMDLSFSGEYLFSFITFNIIHFNLDLTAL